MEKIKRNKMLIVDDTEMNRAVLSEVFADEFTVIEASNGMEALQIIAKYADSLAVVLLDVVMPVSDGFATLTEMKKEGYLESIPVIAMTSNPDNEQDLSIIDLGAEDILCKSFSSKLFKNRVHNVIMAYKYKQLIKEK